MDKKSYNISFQIEGLDETMAKVKKINALMCEIKALAESLEKTEFYIKIQDDK